MTSDSSSRGTFARQSTQVWDNRPSSLESFDASWLNFENGEKRFYGEIKFAQPASKVSPFVTSLWNPAPDSEVVKVSNLIRNGLPEPHVLISITGGAQQFIPSPKLEKVVTGGLYRVAKSTTAWIFSGGTKTGVMKIVGNAVKLSRTAVPTIGVAVFQKIFFFEGLQTCGASPFLYGSPESNPDKAALDANHNYFILVDKPVSPNWTDEINFRTELESRLSLEMDVPVVLLSVHGGWGTLMTIDKALKKRFTIILIKGGGGVTDYLCELRIRNVRAGATSLETPTSSGKTAKEVQDLCNQVIDGWLANEQCFTIYDPIESSEPFDLIMLQAILKNQTREDRPDNERLSRRNKFLLAIEWRSMEGFQELFETEVKNGVSTTTLAIDLQICLQRSLERNFPEVIPYLLNRGASLGSPTTPQPQIDPNVLRLYQLAIKNSLTPKLLKDVFKSQVDTDGQIVTNDSLLAGFIKLAKKSKFPDLISIYYSHYELSTLGGGRKLFDLLIWAALFCRIELCRSLWEHSDFPIHSALIISSIYRFMAQQSLDTKLDYEAGADLFESLATGILDEVETFPDAKQMLTLNWRLLSQPSEQQQLATQNHALQKLRNRGSELWRRGIDALLLAGESQSKIFLAHRHCQRLLDQQFLSLPGEEGKIPSETAYWKIGLLSFSILCPILFLLFLLPEKSLFKGPQITIETTEISDLNQSQSNSDLQKSDSEPLLERTYQTNSPATPLANMIRNPLKIQIAPTCRPPSSSTWSFEFFVWTLIPRFFQIPIVKMFTNTYFYIGFLILLSYIASHPDKDQIQGSEYLLTVWIFALIVDEIFQFVDSPEHHFSTYTNILDLVTLLLFIAYGLLRVIGVNVGSDDVWRVALTILAVTVVLCFLRLMQVFSINNTLGPLLIMIFKMTKDIIKFFVLFSLLFFGFQICFIIVSHEAASFHDDIPEDTWWKEYPDGTMGIAYWAFVGEWNRAFEVLQDSWIGVPAMAIFLLLSQILLLTLLIAMMADTYTEIRKNSDTEWRFSKLAIIREWAVANVLPPPFSLILVARRIYLGYDETTEPEVSADFESDTNIIMCLKRDASLVSRREKEFELNPTIQLMRTELQALQTDLTQVKSQLEASKQPSSS